ncbi:helix-turn-helix domain-containing protein [Streptomyces sp. NPDC001233]|uniref:helix-turn-helix domain-containing protein n=1 Tax=Streptomyces sp. NPDC002589 TaxID=3154420 RepID=UPI00331CC790
MGAAEPDRPSWGIGPHAWDGQERAPLVGPLGRAENHPTAVKLILGAVLRRLREKAGLTPADVKAALGISTYRTSRVETGLKSCRRAEALALLDLYGEDAPERVDECLELVELSHKREWFKAWPDAVVGFVQPLLALEGAAEIVRAYQNYYVPGLLQIPQYTCAVVRAEHPELPAKKVAARAALRDARKKHLEGPDGTKLWAIMEDLVLRRDFGDPAALRAQIEYLIEAAQHPHITLQIAPMQMTQQVSLGNNVTLLHFALDDLPSAVYTEHLLSNDLSTKPEDVERYQKQLDRLAACALDPDETVKELKRYL